MKGVKGIVMIIIAFVLLIISILTLSSFKSCAVPMGDWNIVFTVMLLSIGAVYMINDYCKLADNTMALIVQGTMVFMIVTFLWGDFFLVLTIIESPKCMSIITIVAYLLTMFLGTIVSIIEGFSIMKSVVE